MRAALVIAFVVAIAAPAHAAQYICTGSSPGPGFAPAAEITVDETGKLISADMRWSPKGSATFPVLILAAPVADPASPHLGDLTTLAVGAMITTNPPPKAATADIVITFADGAVMRRPWQMYARNHAAPAPAAAGVPAGSRPVGFFGVIPMMASSLPNPQLAHELALGGRVSVRVVGDDGSVLSESTVDLADTQARDAGLAADFALARDAAKDPVRQCKALPPM